MKHYSTTEEMAAKWGVTSRHVQYLCRRGTIAGAVKRARAWFIPSETPIPIKYTKSNAESLQFVGTRKRVFDCAIELFMLHGFNNVGLREIAECAGISQSAIYGHFKSKREILDTAYDFFCRHHRESRPDLDELKPLFQNGSPIDIIRWCHYDYKEEYLQEMLTITRIIFQRIAIDERAGEIGKALILDEGIQFVEDVFDRAVAERWLAPLDTHAMAILINSVRIYTLMRWIVDSSPDSMARSNADEYALYQRVGRFSTDLKQPGTRD